MVQFLTRVTAELGDPAAILVISAHWEEDRVSVTGGASPQLIYDYYGFPEESYRIRYPAPGAPALAADVAGMLLAAGIDARVDGNRGFDHGVFVPLKIMYPSAQIPCVQLSLQAGLDPAQHLRIGRALRGLRKRDLLVVGSGFSFHNLRAFFDPAGGTADPRNEAFQEWLVETCTREGPPEERERDLSAWEQAPSARYCHPREEHLLPLHVCAGIAGTAARVVFDGHVLGKRTVSFLW
jgi:aromatic ring-opening dioxygenase catalytic subunit (LigB family)